MLFSLIERLQLKRAHAVSALLCPACGEPSDTDETDPRALIACGTCRHVTAAADWADNTLRVAEIYGEAGCPPEGTAVRSFAAELERSWEIPPSGRLNFLLCVGALWTLFIAGFSGLILYGITVGETRDLSKPVVLLILGLFLTPFWAMGLGLLYYGDRAKNVRSRLVIDARSVRLIEIWRGRTRVTSLPLEQVEHMQSVVPVGGQHFRGIEIRGGKTRLRFGGSLTKPERNWLVAECKAAVWPPAA
jgi:hypothetical protein